MATSSYQTYLMYKASNGASYTKLIDIKNYGDLGGSPETLETTTLSDEKQTNILGVQSMDSMEFVCNYDKEDFNTLNALTGQYDFALYLGADSSGNPDGHEGIFKWKGELRVWLTGKGVNEVREMNVAVAASTVVTFEIPT